MCQNGGAVGATTTIRRCRASGSAGRARLEVPGGGSHKDLGAVLVPGGRAPVLIARPLLSKMKPGSVIVDVAVDQGGCIETCRPTTHHDPTFIVDGVVHYCVANIPGAVCKTSSRALCNATLPYLRELAGLGAEKFAAVDSGRAASINIAKQKIVNQAVSEVFPDLPRA